MEAEEERYNKYIQEKKERKEQKKELNEKEASKIKNKGDELPKKKK